MTDELAADHEIRLQYLEARADARAAVGGVLLVVLAVVAALAFSGVIRFDLAALNG